jgi:hypothetical protein
LPRHLRHRYERGLSVVQAESCEMDGTSNLIAVRRLLLAPDDPEVCGPAPAATLPPAPQTSHDVDAPAAARRNRSRTQAATTSWGLMPA